MTFSERRSRALSLVSDDLSNAESELAELVSERAVIIDELRLDGDATTEQILARIRELATVHHLVTKRLSFRDDEVADARAIVERLDYAVAGANALGRIAGSECAH